MAEAKKKTAKKAAVKEVDAATELANKQADLAQARVSHKAGELVNPRVLTSTRREIARLKTQIRQEELKERKK